MSCGVIGCTRIAPAVASCSDFAASVAARAPTRRRAPAAARRSKRAAGARDDDDVRESRRAPASGASRQTEECVGADDQRQRSRRILVAQLLEREHRVAAPWAIDLAPVDLEARTTRRPRARTIARRCAAVATGAARCGGSPAGMRRTAASRSAQRTSRASSRCPQWIGSKVPPKTPRGRAWRPFYAWLCRRSPFAPGCRRFGAPAQCSAQQWQAQSK